MGVDAMSNEFWIQMIVYAITIGSLAGTILTKLKYLEGKMDKHNNLVEKVAVVQESLKSAHKRIDDIRDEINAA